MTCVRQNDTCTGQKIDGFFVGHDLGHYAIETTLGLRSAFFGMLARGWDIEDFGTPWPRGPFPPDALHDLTLTENLAGLLDREHQSIPECGVEELNRLLGECLMQVGQTLRRPLTATELTRIRATRGELEARWEALPPGATMELPFPAAGDR